MAPSRGVRTYRSEARRLRSRFFAIAAAAVALGALDVVALSAVTSPAGVQATAHAAPAPRSSVTSSKNPRDTVSRGGSTQLDPPPRAGLWTFRGDARRAFYGVGPVPRRDPRIVWRYPRTGNMCAVSRDETGGQTWCGIGWTGQPNVIPRADGRVEVRVGAFDRAYHFVDGATGTRIRPPLRTGDLAKGSATSDPDGYPLYYAGSRDNRLRIVALDRRRPTVLWSLDSHAGGPVVWNDDWDGAPLVIHGHLLVGGENSWFYVIRLNRRYRPDGKVAVRPRVIARVPSWDGRLLAARSDRAFSIESSVSYHRGVAYFANSAGLVQGWDVRRTLRHGDAPRRVFRFWMGDDTDATVAVDDEGFLYAAAELERFDGRSREVGQLVKLDPRRPGRPVVWSVPLRRIGRAGKAGSWSTPAIDRSTVYVATNAGGVVAVDRRSGRIRWTVPLPGPTWGSPVVVDGVLLEGDCLGALHAFDVRRERRRPRQLWSIRLGGCIESTPAVWRGRIYIGTRGGALYAIGDSHS
jgi:outer membrane protein assembly factor BamB